MKKILRKVKYWWFNVRNMPNAIYMCIRFPFLYPRNVWSGKHYTNWKIQGKMCSLYNKHHIFRTEDHSATGGSHFEVVENRWKSKKYEIYYNFLGFLESFLGIFHCVPTHSIHTWIPYGWRKAFGVQLWKEIRHSLYKTGSWKAVRSFRIHDIKEKYGELQIYPAAATPEVYKIIRKYEYISGRTCIICGEPATCETPVEYWKCPYCDEHAPRKSRFLLDFGLYNSWYGVSGNVNGRDGDELVEREQMIKDYEKQQNDDFLDSDN